MPYTKLQQLGALFAALGQAHPAANPHDLAAAGEKIIRQVRIVWKMGRLEKPNARQVTAYAKAIEQLAALGQAWGFEAEINKDRRVFVRFPFRSGRYKPYPLLIPKD